jgi:hypothetical protein
VSRLTFDIGGAERHRVGVILAISGFTSRPPAKLQIGPIKRDRD